MMKYLTPELLVICNDETKDILTLSYQVEGNEVNIDSKSYKDLIWQ